MINLEILDLILSHIKSNKKVTEFNIKNLVFSNLLYENLINDLIIEKSLEKLIDDNYVKAVEDKVKISDDWGERVVYYVSTPQSYNFVGYLNTFYSKLSLEKQNKTLLESQLAQNLSMIATNDSVQSTNRRMKDLTLVIALGTSVAAIYYLIEIFSLFCKPFC
jgi:hypothetical protein